MLKTAIMFTLIDASATYIWIRTGIAIEGNPILASLIETIGPEATLLARAAVGIVLLLVLAQLAKEVTWARYALNSVTVILGLICAYHAIGPFL